MYEAFKRVVCACPKRFLVEQLFVFSHMWKLLNIFYLKKS